MDLRGEGREFNRGEVVSNGEIVSARPACDVRNAYRRYRLGASGSLGVVFRGSMSVLITK